MDSILLLLQLISQLDQNDTRIHDLALELGFNPNHSDPLMVPQLILIEKLPKGQEIKGFPKYIANRRHHSIFEQNYNNKKWSLGYNFDLFNGNKFNWTIYHDLIGSKGLKFYRTTKKVTSRDLLFCMVRCIEINGEPILHIITDPNNLDKCVDWHAADYKIGVYDLISKLPQPTTI